METYTFQEIEDCELQDSLFVLKDEYDELEEERDNILEEHNKLKEKIEEAWMLI